MIDPFLVWLERFSLTGSISPIVLGANRRAIIETLGEPQDTAQGIRTAEAPMILRYGRVEFHFGPAADDGLCMIYAESTDGVPELVISSVSLAQLGDSTQSLNQPVGAMSNKTTIASAANVLPSALASLRGLGFSVSKTANGQLCRAENADCVLMADDLLSLLGLATLRSLRGDAWRPADEEVEQLLSFEESQDSR